MRSDTDDSMIEEARGMASAMIQAAKAHPCKHPAPLVMLSACLMLTETVATLVPGETESAGKAVLLLATQLLTGRVD